MCGIIGIVGTEPVASALYDGLTVLQHRGQDAAGIAVMDGTRIRVHKGRGLVRDVFDEATSPADGRISIGHRYRPPARREPKSPAVLRQFALRHCPRAQTTAGQHRCDAAG